MEFPGRLKQKVMKCLLGVYDISDVDISDSQLLYPKCINIISLKQSNRLIGLFPVCVCMSIFVPLQLFG